jgi:amidophosphoribosyltransferase
MPLETVGEACGVFGIYAPGQSVANLAYLGLYALQHRGQESAGIAVSDGETMTVVKDMGLVAQVFDENNLAPLAGHLAIGHVRYSTTGSSNWRNAQPIYRSVADAGFALAHNGNLTNTPSLAANLGMLPGVGSVSALGADSTTDSDLVAECIVQAYADPLGNDGRDLERALRIVLPTLEGAFSFTLMDEAHLIGVRDPHGFRPLVLGRIEGGDTVVVDDDEYIGHGEMFNEHRTMRRPLHDCGHHLALEHTGDQPGAKGGGQQRAGGECDPE